MASDVTSWCRGFLPSRRTLNEGASVHLQLPEEEVNVTSA